MDGVGRVKDGIELASADGSSKRSRKRDSLFLSARLRLGDESEAHEVRVRNLSAGGLMAELDRTVAQGTPVHLELRGLGELTGTVAWCTRGRMGIAFDCPIDPARARKPVGSGGRTPGYAKPLIVPVPRR